MGMEGRERCGVPRPPPPQVVTEDSAKFKFDVCICLSSLSQFIKTLTFTGLFLKTCAWVKAYPQLDALFKNLIQWHTLNE